jgi:predicted RNA-binding Zn ribbon-like protein
MVPDLRSLVKWQIRHLSVRIRPVSTPPSTAPLLGEPLPIELMNTIWADRNGVHEALGSPTDAATWLWAVESREDAPLPGLGPWIEQAPQRDLERLHRDLRALRDAGRRLAARRTHDDRPAAQTALEAAQALSTVNQYAASAHSWPVLEWSDREAPRTRVASESTAGSAFIAGLARATVTLLTGENGDALRACQAPGCVLYFLKQHPRREWCSAACGNRARQARHYRRHRG